MMKKDLISATRIIGRLSLIIWGVLSLIVIFFLIDARLHPHEKGISIADILDYAKISAILLLLFAICKLLYYINVKPHVKRKK